MSCDHEYTRKLEHVIKQMLVPLKDIPFNLVIETLTGHRVIRYNASNSNHRAALEALVKAAVDTAGQININGILRPRPNEIGNDIEPFVKTALINQGLTTTTPSSASGKKKSTGYPDILFFQNKIPYYVECKTYNIENIDTTQRSFYLSPSDDFKVVHDAIHFLLSFEIFVFGEAGKNHIYKCKHIKILSLEELSLDVKYEFNSDNRRMYSGSSGAILLHEQTV